MKQTPKKPSITVTLLGAILALNVISCAATPRKGIDVKVYYSKPETGGVTMSDQGVIVPYADTEGFRCLARDDWRELLKLIANLRADAINQ